MSFLSSRTKAWMDAGRHFKVKNPDVDAATITLFSAEIAAYYPFLTFTGDIRPNAAKMTKSSSGVDAGCRESLF